MSRYGQNTSYRHRIQKLFPDCYRLSWTVDRYYAGSRLRHPTGMSRDTDEKGARRFAKKWELSFFDLPHPKETDHG